MLFISLILASAPSVNATEPTWSPDTPLITNPADDWNPSCKQIIQDTNWTIWVVWTSNRTGNYDIYYRTSSDGGANWSDEKPLTNDSKRDEYPSIMQTSNGSIWVVWAKFINSQWDLYYRTSNDGGVNWSDEKPLTIDLDNDLTPSITTTANGTIWIVWQSDRIWVWDPEANESIPQDDIFYKTSSDGGVNWSDETQLTTDLKDDIDPSITQTTDGKIWVTWVSDRYDERDIFYTTSSDGGDNWSDSMQLTEYVGDDYAPSITQTIDDTIWIIWSSRREGNWDIYYKTSSDGVSWTEDRLTTDPNVDGTPSITQTADGTVWIVWASDRTENYDLWYTTTTITVHDVAITNVTPYPTTAINGETVSINVTVTNKGTQPETFNVTVYADKDKTTIGDEITVGTHTVTNLALQDAKTLTFAWNTTNVLPGNYTLSATAGPLLGETKLADNTLVDGTVNVVTRDVAILGINLSSTWVYQGTTINITVEVKNKGSVKETFNVTAYTSTAIIGTQTVTNLAPNATITLTFNWNTTSTSPGNHTVSATAGPVPNEKNLTDNTYIDGTVRVIIRDVAVLNVVPSQSLVIWFENFDVDVVVANEGTISETFTVTLYADSTPINSLNVTLPPSTSTTLTFTQKTDKYTLPANYTLSASANPVPGEKDLADNTYTDGIITVAARDVAIHNITITPERGIIQGETVYISVETKNEGTISETFTVTLYADSTPINSLNVTLPPSTSTTLTFNWNTTNVTPANYTILAYAWPVPGEKNIIDNSLDHGSIQVRIPGDIDGDFDVDKFDFGTFAIAFGSNVGEPRYNLYADINQDGKVDKFDFGKFAPNFGKGA